MNEVTLEFSATIIRQHPITQSDVDTLVSEAKQLMLKEKEILARGGDPTSELGSSALFRSLPSAEAEEKNSGQMDKEFRRDTVKDKRVEKNAKKNKMGTTLKDSTVKGKGRKLKGDQKSSASCMIL